MRTEIRAFIFLLLIALIPVKESYCCFPIQSFITGGKSPKIRWLPDLPAGEFHIDTTLLEIRNSGCQSFLAGTTLFDQFQNRPDQLKNALKSAGIQDWILDAGVLPFDGTDKPETMKYLKKLAGFAGNTGASFLLVAAEKRDSYPPGKAKLTKLSMALDVLAATAAQYGLKILLTNSMHSLCQTADELEFTMAQCKSRNTGILLDLAMMAQSGTAPEEAIRKWKKKIAGIRFNDLSKPVKGFAGSTERNYRIEIPGKGNAMNYSAIFSALQEMKYRGFGILSTSYEGKKSAPGKAAKSAKEYLLQTGFRF